MGCWANRSKTTLATIPQSAPTELHWDSAPLLDFVYPRVFVYTAARFTQPRDPICDRELVPRQINTTSGQSWVHVTHMLRLDQDDGHSAYRGSFIPPFDHQRSGYTLLKTAGTPPGDSYEIKTGLFEQKGGWYTAA